MSRIFLEFLLSLGNLRIKKEAIDQCKQEVHDQTLVGKKADSAVF